MVCEYKDGTESYCEIDEFRDSIDISLVESMIEVYGVSNEYKNRRVF
jgi:hypothetical protein